MTEEDQIIAMLKRCNIGYTLSAYKFNLNLTSIEVNGQNSKHVYAPFHCHIQWLFDKEGRLVRLEFGY